MNITDKLGRVVKDLRISVTDRCNFRCNYCMPIEKFPGNFKFMPRKEILSFEEIELVAKAFAELGVTKIRLTGGEPLLRKDLSRLIEKLSKIEGIGDLALTTNGDLLGNQAQRLKDSGLHRITVSLDALDKDIFFKMNGNFSSPKKIIQGIETAIEAGLLTKINMVVRKNINGCQVLPIAHLGCKLGVETRFIEFMDVGSKNSWDLKDVFSKKDILQKLSADFSFIPIGNRDKSDVAKVYQSTNKKLTIGIISSISEPFCSNCTRARLTAEGKLFTCLFGRDGIDLKSHIRGGSSRSDLKQLFQKVWSNRNDQYSMQRKQLAQQTQKAEMHYLGG